jgi:hypothetical protein
MTNAAPVARNRLYSSTAAVLALGALSGCSYFDRSSEPTYEPRPAATQPTYQQPIYEQPTATTFAIGEEDGGYTTQPTDNFATTLAVGEEDGTGPIPVEPNGGIGDGAGPIPKVEGDFERVYIDEPSSGGAVTTFAIGEEDGGGIQPPTVQGNFEPVYIDEPAGGFGGGATTLAIGEEG